MAQDKQTKETKVEVVDGENVYRTVTTSDVTLADLQAALVNIDKAIAQQTERVIAPLEAKKAEIEAQIAELEK